MNADARTSAKEKFIEPELTNYGKLEDITLQGGQPNADVPQGGANTAYTPG